MSRLWHGYVAFQKPAAVDAGDWTTALAALKAELDETPSADQPSERWHDVTNGDTTIAEAMFDLSKLNTTDLSTTAGVDMTDAWEPLRPIQGWEYSRTKAQSLIDDRGWDLVGYTDYYPEDYGTVDGDPANDTAAVQGAIDAAIANYVATGELSRVDGRGNTYVLQEAGTLTASLGSTGYALLIDGDGVGIEDATFELDAGSLPSSTRFTAIVVGNAGGNTGAPGEDGSWRYTNWIKDVTVDGSALSTAQREAISTGAFCGTILFLYCQDMVCRNVTVTDGWSGNAVLGTLASSRYGLWLENDVQSAVCGTATGVARGYWFDGGRYILSLADQAAVPCAVSFVGNLDNTDYATGMTAGVCRNNVVVNGAFTGLGDAGNRVAVNVQGSDDTEIVDSSFTTAAGESMYCFRVSIQTRAGAATATCSRVILRGNTMTSQADSTRPVFILGADDDLNTDEADDPVLVRDLEFKDNVLTGFTRRGWFANEHCVGAVFSGNTYPGGTTTYGYTTPADEATVVANNALQ